MLTFNYGSPYFWDKVVSTKFISGCRMVWDLICGTSWSQKTEKVTGGRKFAILPNWSCLLSITVLFTHPCFEPKVPCVKSALCQKSLESKVPWVKSPSGQKYGSSVNICSVQILPKSAWRNMVKGVFCFVLLLTQENLGWQLQREKTAHISKTFFRKSIRIYDEINCIIY